MSYKRRKNEQNPLKSAQKAGFATLKVSGVDIFSTRMTPTFYLRFWCSWYVRIICRRIFFWKKSAIDFPRAIWTRVGEKPWGPGWLWVGGISQILTRKIEKIRKNWKFYLSCEMHHNHQKKCLEDVLGTFWAFFGHKRVVEYRSGGQGSWWEGAQLE